MQATYIVPFTSSVLQRKFIRETKEGLEVDLHKKFSAWVVEKGLSSPTQEEWRCIMEEDKLVLLQSYMKHTVHCNYDAILLIYIYYINYISFCSLANVADGPGEIASSYEEELDLEETQLPVATGTQPGPSHDIVASLRLSDIRSIFD